MLTVEQPHESKWDCSRIHDLRTAAIILRISMHFTRSIRQSIEAVLRNRHIYEYTDLPYASTEGKKCIDRIQAHLFATN